MDIKRLLPGLLAVSVALSIPARSAERGATPPKAGETTKAMKPKVIHKTFPNFGSVERLDGALDSLIAPDAKLELLAEGFSWSEGPAWIDRDGGYLVFSDVPQNTVYQWKESDGVSVFLKPSGYTGAKPRAGEPGSNGLTIDSAGRVVLCEHGDRRVTRLEKNGKKTVLAEYYNFMRFNSPNDLVYSKEGHLYFTDPPYGLEGKNDDKEKEMMFNGVYMLHRNGTLVLLTKEMTYPNGVAVSADEKTLYIANSDEKMAIWKKFDINQTDGTISNGRVFFDATSLVAGRKGLPDGMKVDKKGNLFASGPGGILVLTPEGKHLGTINTGEATANCAWGNDGSVLYITANNKLARIRTLTKGKGY